MIARPPHALITACLALAIAGYFAPAADPQENFKIRMGASTAVVNGDINENDARAAIKSWADTFSVEAGLRIEHMPEVISTPDQLVQRIRLGQLDAFSLTIPEYLKVSSLLDPNLFLVDQSYISGGEEYLILVHADSDMRTIADLRGHSLIRYTGIVMCLAPEWLETLLDAAKLPPPATFFGAITPNVKLSRSVLPVFFKQTDACLVNRRGFETMCELNPQLRVKLRVVATSPKLVPVVVGFHKNCPPQSKEKFKTALCSLGDSPLGRQLLSLFGSRQVIATGPSILTRTLELMAASTRIQTRSAQVTK